MNEVSMRIGILGTGSVGTTLAGALAARGNEVVVGTRDPAGTMARTEPGPMGNPPFPAWQAEHPEVRLGTFAEAAEHGEVVINASNGAASLEVLKLAGAEHLEGKILVDVSNPLEFSGGVLSLWVANTDSLAERIQRAFPGAKVVKTLNTMNAPVMVDPGRVAGGEHHVFVSGDDPQARTRVAGLLRDWFGWRHVLDLGDLTSARGAEMILPLWIRVMGSLGTAEFNFRIATGAAPAADPT
ncbi:MAG TPA: NAD(P)-binding domain-containing protein [Actinomycetes bacterium]|nr:NAD(P)-binding domain-containing protein [Actinomycetes bacterium]